MIPTVGPAFTPCTVSGGETPVAPDTATDARDAGSVVVMKPEETEMRVTVADRDVVPDGRVLLEALRLSDVDEPGEVPVLLIEFDDEDWVAPPTSPKLYRAASVGNSWGVTSIGRGFKWADDEQEIKEHFAFAAVCTAPCLPLLYP